MLTVFIRILLRYGAGALVAAGWLLPADGTLLAGDPDVLEAALLAVGFLTLAITEAWYWLARKTGRAT